jgi:hypothetical protein
MRDAIVLIAHGVLGFSGRAKSAMANRHTLPDQLGEL